MSAPALLDRLRARRIKAAAPPPDVPIDSVVAMKFLDLVEVYSAAYTAHVEAVGRLEAASGELANAEAWESAAARAAASGAGLTVRGADPHESARSWTDGRDAARAAALDVGRAARDRLVAESAEAMARAAREEAVVALVESLDAAAEADRFLALKSTLASRAVESARGEFTSAVARRMEARRARRGPRTPEELEHALGDGTRLAEAASLAEEADRALKAAEAAARAASAERVKFARAVEAALASERAAGRAR